MVKVRERKKERGQKKQEQNGENEDPFALSFFLAKAPVPAVQLADHPGKAAHILKVWDLRFLHLV